MPPLSIVTTIYNREQYLSAAIESILTQTDADFELLLWDDGSTDASVEIAQHYAAQDKRIQVIAAPHQGRAPALKAAVAATTGRYVGLVDSDDLLAATALAETKAVLDQQPAVGLVYTDYMVIDEQSQVTAYGERCRVPYSKDRLLLEFMLFHFRLMRRSVYDKVGGFNETFQCCQDYELCLRLSEVTEIQHLAKPLYYYRYHQDSISGQQRVAQIHWSQQAIEQTLIRRGMADDYGLEVQIYARFGLFRKPGNTTEPNHKDESHTSAFSHAVAHTKLPDCINPKDFTNWALAPEALEWLAHFIQTQTIWSVIELGSGLSTILFAALQRDGLLERSLSLEHDANWYSHTIAQLKQKDLLDYAQVQLCPLRQVALHQELVKWYDITAIVPFTADLILVDGPPSHSDPLARQPAPHLLQPFIRSGTWIVLDDCQRQAEQETVTRWLKELPHLKLIETVAIDTGLALLRFD